LRRRIEAGPDPDAAPRSHSAERPANAGFQD